MYCFKIPFFESKIERAQKILDDAQRNYDKVIENLKNDDTLLSENKQIHCLKCGHNSKVKKYKYAKFFWYEAPHGCMDGDMWHFGGYFLTCPVCGWDEKIYLPANKTFGPAKTNELNAIEFKFMKNLLTYAIKEEDRYDK